MRTVTTLVLSLALALPLSACDQVGGAVGDARQSVESGLQTLRWCTAAFRLGAAVASRDVEAGRSAAEDLQADAPEELTDEIALILDAIAAAETSDLSQLRSEEVQDAGRRVLDVAEERCDPTTRPE